MIDELGIYLGQVFENGETTYVRYRGDRHLLTVGPTGSGKGQSLIIPNLAHLGHSIVVIDPKGEAAAITAERRRRMGQRVVILNPFGELGLKSDGFNPLRGLSPKSDTFADDANEIASALVPHNPEVKDPFWDDSARDVLSALIMYVATGGRDGELSLKVAPEFASLTTVRDLLTKQFETPGGKDSLKGIFEFIQTSDIRALRHKASAMLGQSDAKVIAGILLSARTSTQSLDSEPISVDLETGTFDFASMNKTPTTVYVILPAKELGPHGKWLRLIVASALRALLKTTASQKVRPVLFVLDEFASLGHMPIIEDAIAYARGYGVQIWPFLQDFNQLKRLYNDGWESFVSGAGALTAFASQDRMTSQFLSDLVGFDTVSIEKVSLDPQKGEWKPTVGPEQIQKMLPQDVRRMGKGNLLLLRESGPAMLKAPRYEDTVFNDVPVFGKLQPNPHAPRGI